MKRIFLAASMIALLAGSSKAQTADEIIAKHIDAIGGKETINKINSLYLEGTTQVMGNESPTKITILNGKGYKNESEFNGQKIIQVFTDKGGWGVNPMAGPDAAVLPDDAYKAGKEQIYVGGPFPDYAAKGSTVTLLGKEGNNYKIKLVDKDKQETTYLFDAATYYISKATRKANMMGQEIEMNISFADYKKTDAGFMVPFAMTVDLGQFQLATVFTKAVVNQPVDPAIFVMPK